MLYHWGNIDILGSLVCGLGFDELDTSSHRRTSPCLLDPVRCHGGNGRCIRDAQFEKELFNSD